MIDCVATLIARPERASDLDAVVLACREAFRGSRLDWLADGEAVDFFIAAPDAAELTHRLRTLVGDRPVDVVVQPAAARRKKLLVADMDSTMIGQECIDELADFVGLRARVAAITERAMRGELEFAPALRERVALLAELPLATIDRVIAERIVPNPGARTLIATMRANGGFAILVSGGFTAFTAKVGAMLGFDEVQANVLLHEKGRLTGRVAEPILGRAAKRGALEAAILRLRIARSDTLAVGDGANDLDMIMAAGLGVAYHAKPMVAEAAKARIDHADLTALLYMQGYKQAEFAP